MGKYWTSVAKQNTGCACDLEACKLDGSAEYSCLCPHSRSNSFWGLCGTITRFWVKLNLEVFVKKDMKIKNQVVSKTGAKNRETHPTAHTNSSPRSCLVVSKYSTTCRQVSGCSSRRQQPQLAPLGTKDECRFPVRIYAVGNGRVGLCCEQDFQEMFLEFESHWLK